MMVYAVAAEAGVCDGSVALLLRDEDGWWGSHLIITITMRLTFIILTSCWMKQLSSTTSASSFFSLFFNIIFLSRPNQSQKTKTTMLIRNVLFLGACYTSSITGFNTAKPIARTSSLRNSYLDSIGADGDNKPTNAESSTPPPPPAARVEEPPSIDLEGQIVDRQSNLSFRENRNYQSVNDDPRPFDMESRLVPFAHPVVFIYIMHAFCVHHPCSFVWPFWYG